ncbi:hypothetical protein CLOM_g10930 [Closterium sp. NIES-68]|nr:hypothetical protein CLOM_g10930 [Closterium sp. NIES-68]GJP57794.1 hypothetical protein CLOP_g17387 [Closterium sp. NIES-67]
MVNTVNFGAHPASPVSAFALEMFSRVCCDLDDAACSSNSGAESDVPYFRDSLDYNTCDSESARWEAELACSPIWIDEARSRIRSAALAVVETQQQSLHLTSLADSHMHEADLSDLDVSDGCFCISPKSPSSKSSSEGSSKAGVLRFIATSLRLRK